MSHIDAGCVIAGFLLLFQASGDYSFSSLHNIGAAMSPGTRNAAFVLFLLGFGIKSGIVPLHIWLPAAHPVAPSNVSALMSGVLIKTGIYGLARVCFDFLGPPPLWWGVTILAVGTVSAVLGVLYALMEHDLKRLLAYHSIENIGIILMGLGASLIFLHTGHPLLASLSLIAGMYHTINHASFKGLVVPRCGRGGARHAHPQHGRNGRAGQTNAANGLFLSDRRSRHFRPAAAQRICQRMADLPVLAARLWCHGKHVAAGVSLERGDAGFDRRAGGGLFRQGLRHHFPGPTPQRSRRATRVEAAPSMRAGHGRADRRLRAARTFSHRLHPSARSADPTTHSANKSAAQLSLANGLVLASLAEMPGTISMLRPGVDGGLSSADSAGPVADFRAEGPDAARADLGLRPARA